MEYFIEHYTDQIMKSSSREYYIITANNKEFHIAFIDEKEVIEMEQVNLID